MPGRRLRAIGNLLLTLTFLKQLSQSLVKLALLDESLRSEHCYLSHASVFGFIDGALPRKYEASSRIVLLRTSFFKCGF